MEILKQGTRCKFKSVWSTELRYGTIHSYVDDEGGNYYFILTFNGKPYYVSPHRVWKISEEEYILHVLES